MTTQTKRTASLSICVPIYNFGHFIEQTLDSILGQDAASEIEIIVIDGASTDNTQTILRELAKQYRQIRYTRLAERGGIDRDMAKAVDQATGDYCWLFSGDDVMVKGALSRIMEEISFGHDVYICKHMECTFDMAPIGEWPVLRSRHATVFDLGCTAVRHRYFALAENTEAFCSFMGGVIVKRSVWNSVPLNESFVGSCWAHVARFFELSQNRLLVKYLPEVLVHRRGENDSFASRGVVNRLKLAIAGFNELADVFFGHNSIEGLHIRRAIRGDLKLGTLIAAKVRCKEYPALENKVELDKLVGILYSRSSIKGEIEHLIYCVFPDDPRFARLARRIYRLIRFRQGSDVAV
jgi:abequosyltransferase